MLLQFTVENFLSFRDETNFDLFPTGLQAMLDHIYTDFDGKKVQALPVSVIYGANAGGKTNLLAAIHFAAGFIKNGVGLNRPIGAPPFLLDPMMRDKPSRFEFVFKTGGVVYSYGFVLSQWAVEEEWLFAYFSSREEVIFERNRTAPSFRLGRRLKKRELGGADTCVSRNALFVTFAHEKSEILEAVYRWFAESLVVIPADLDVQNMAKIVHCHPELGRFISGRLKEADVGIESIFTKEEKRDQIFRNDSSSVSVGDIENGTRHSMYSRHLDTSGNEVVLPISVESDGTRRMIELLPMLNAKDNRDRVFFIDEVDRSMHPMLSKWLLENCINIAKSKQAGTCQFIFTTHDTNLLDRNILRRDEIWFTEKDSNGCSRLSRLSEFKVNEGMNYENGYLNGRFGGIPFPAAVGETP